MDTALLYTHLREMGALYDELAQARVALADAPRRRDDLAALGEEYAEDVAHERAEVDDRRRAARRLEGELRDLEARLQDRRRRTAELEDPVALAAAEAELQTLAARRDSLEAELLSTWEGGDRDRAALSTAEAEVSGRREELAEEAAAQLERSRRAEVAAEEIDAELAGRLGRLPRRLARQLERIATRWPNPVAGLSGGACGCCGYSLPAQEAIDADNERKLVNCPGCGRFVVVRRGLRRGEWT